MRNDDFSKALYDRVLNCTMSDFKDLLHKFGEDKKHLATIQSAMNHMINAYDPDCFNGKEKMLKDYRLGLGEFKGSFNKNASSPALEQILAKLENISERLADLESRQPIVSTPKKRASQNKKGI